MKVRTKKVSIPVGEIGNINNMFNDMVGEGIGSIKISYPKYINIRNICTKIVKVLYILEDSVIIKSYENERKEIREFCELSTSTIKDMFSMEIDVDDENKTNFKEFMKLYESAKQSKMIKTLIVMADRLITYNKYIGDSKSLNIGFLRNMPGIEWKPLPFTDLNFKGIIIDNYDNNGVDTYKFIMTVLNKLLVFSYDIYKETTSPDINPDEFIATIMSNIIKIQKLPALSRCNRAFKKILDSVMMLKTNFSDYYRDFMETKDNTVIMQNFIADVCKQTSGSDPELIREFRTIILFYKNVATNNKILDPKIQKLFDSVNSGFSMLEKDTQNLRKPKDENDVHFGGENNENNENDEECVEDGIVINESIDANNL